MHGRVFYFERWGNLLAGNLAAHASAFREARKILSKSILRILHSRISTLHDRIIIAYHPIVIINVASSII